MWSCMWAWGLTQPWKGGDPLPPWTCSEINQEVSLGGSGSPGHTGRPLGLYPSGLCDCMQPDWEVEVSSSVPSLHFGPQQLDWGNLAWPRDEKAPGFSPALSSSFFHGMQQRTMCAILRHWRWRPWGPGTPICMPRTAPALEPLHSILGGKASVEKVTGQGCRANWAVGGESRCRAWTEGPRTARHSPQAPSAPALLVGFPRAAGQQRQGQCLLLWWVRAQQSRGAARWCQHTLQRR